MSIHLPVFSLHENSWIFVTCADKSQMAFPLLGDMVAETEC